MIVDPKAADYAVYRGATVITPNRKELAETTRLATPSERGRSSPAATKLDQELGSEAVLVRAATRG